MTKYCFEAVLGEACKCVCVCACWHFVWECGKHLPPTVPGSMWKHMYVLKPTSLDILTETTTLRYRSCKQVTRWWFTNDSNVLRRLGTLNLALDTYRFSTQDVRVLIRNFTLYNKYLGVIQKSLKWQILWTLFAWLTACHASVPSRLHPCVHIWLSQTTNKMATSGK